MSISVDTMNLNTHQAKQLDRLTTVYARDLKIGMIAAHYPGLYASGEDMDLSPELQTVYDEKVTEYINNTIRGMMASTL